MCYNQNMEELIFEDFVEMEKIDHQYFPVENITPAKEAYKWYLKRQKHHSCNQRAWRGGDIH